MEPLNLEQFAEILYGDNEGDADESFYHPYIDRYLESSSNKKQLCVDFFKRFNVGTSIYNSDDILPELSFFDSLLLYVARKAQLSKPLLFSEVFNFTHHEQECGMTQQRYFDQRHCNCWTGESYSYALDKALTDDGLIEQ